MFNIHESSEYYIDLGSLELGLKLQILDGDGLRAGVDAAANVYFTNNLSTSLFPIVKIYINNNCDETQYHANHISRLHHLMDVEENIASNRGICQGLFPIKPAKIGTLINNAIMGANEPRKHRNHHLQKEK